MTLILTAICDDDIFACADTRYTDQKWNGGFKDGFDKIYKFSSPPLLIVNHGVNRFGDGYWDYYCSIYEKSERWKDKDLESIASDFKNYIEKVILAQLKANIMREPNNTDVRKSGFAICGKNIKNGKFEIYEFFWNPKPEFPGSYPWTGIRLNGFGNGYDLYLKEDLAKDPDGFVNWNMFRRKKIRSELSRLFILAKEKKKQMGGKEFSDNYVIKSVAE